MGWRRVVRASLLATTLLLAAVGCGAGGGDDNSSGGGTDRTAEAGDLIGVSLPTTVSARWITDGENLGYQFERLGYTTDVQFAEDDPKRQIAQIQQMIDSGARALVISAVNSTALNDVLAKAAAAKIKVIAYDRLLLNTADVDYYATFDNRRVGVLQATYLVEQLGLDSGGGTANIELFAGSADDNNAKLFFDGSMSVLKPYIDSGRVVVRSGQTSFSQVVTKAWNGDLAARRMTDILEEHYDGSEKLDGVLAPYDGITRGVLRAVQTAGVEMPVITGQDAEIDSVKLIAAGKQGQTVFKDTRKLAEVAAKMTNAALTGGKPEINDTSQYDNGVKVVPTFLLQPVTVVKSNYEDILVKSGYYSAAQLS